MKKIWLLGFLLLFSLFLITACAKKPSSENKDTLQKLIDGYEGCANEFPIESQKFITESKNIDPNDYEKMLEMVDNMISMSSDCKIKTGAFISFLEDPENIKAFNIKKDVEYDSDMESLKTSLEFFEKNLVSYKGMRKEINDLLASQAN